MRGWTDVRKVHGTVPFSQVDDTFQTPQVINATVVESRIDFATPNTGFLITNRGPNTVLIRFNGIATTLDGGYSVPLPKNEAATASQTTISRISAICEAGSAKVVIQPLKEPPV